MVKFFTIQDLKEKNFPLLGKKVTDTEVLINMYQKYSYKKVPQILNGMFAYVVFDKTNERLIVVNDVQGEKNLYYFEDDNYYIISSTIKAIISFVGKLNLNHTSLKNYFYSRHFMPLNNTPYKNIKLYENGINLTFSLKNFEKKI